MQYLQPMHLRKYWTTIPSSRWKVAFAGQTVTQGGCSHCMHGMGMTSVRTWGYFPLVTAIILCQKISLLECCSSGDPWGTLFSSLQATTHAWHPTHLSRSITMPHFAISSLVFVPARRSGYLR